MNDGINSGVDNQPNKIEEVDMNMPCVSLDGKVWTNLNDAIQYNETYYNSITNELKTTDSDKDNIIDNVQNVDTGVSELNHIYDKQLNSNISDETTIKPFKSLDGKEWGNIDQAMEYNKLYFEKMKIRDNLIIDEEKHGFGSR